MAFWLSVSMAKRDSCVLPWRWHCLPRAGDQALGRCTIPELQRALLASPPAAKHDRIAACWGSGEFSTSTSVRTNAHGAVSQGPVPLPLTWSPVLPDPAVPRHVPGGRLQGHMDHFNWSGKEQLASEPSTSRGSLCRQVWEQLGGAGQRQIRSFIGMFRKSHSWKRNPASFLLPPNRQLQVLGDCSAWVCTSASTFWSCILSIQHGCRDAVVSHARRCPWRVAHAQVPTPAPCRLWAHPALLPLTASLGLRTQTTSTGSSRAHQARLGVVLAWLCSPVSPADLGTVAQCQAGTNPAGRARNSGWEARRCLELSQLPWLVLNMQNWS